MKRDHRQEKGQEDHSDEASSSESEDETSVSGVDATDDALSEKSRLVADRRDRSYTGGTINSTQEEEDSSRLGTDSRNEDHEEDNEEEYEYQERASRNSSRASIVSVSSPPASFSDLIKAKEAEVAPPNSLFKASDIIAENTAVARVLKISSDIQIAYTFWLMKKRQWERLYRGTYTKPKPFYLTWIVMFLALYGSYLGLQLFYFRRREGFILEFILMGFMSASMIFIFPRLQWFARVILLECYGFFMTFFLMDLYYKPKKYLPIGAGDLGLMFLTLIWFLIYPYIFRVYITVTGSVIPKLAQAKDEGGNVRLEILQKSWFFWEDEVQCIYQGPLKNGKPDGMGIWIDTSNQGEFLHGWWEDGVPVGPFESWENGTRSMLVNVRIFYCTNAGGKLWLERTPLKYGISGVECCVSGNFFKGYPTVSMIYERECKCTSKSNCKCVGKLLSNKSYRHIDDQKELRSVVVSAEGSRLSVSGHKPRRAGVEKIAITLVKDKPHKSHLRLDEDWITSPSSEGLLFLHGYDHNLKDSLKRFGQFLALGHFPAYLKPFVFNWPSSTNPLFYWCAHSVASDNDNHRDLRKFIKSLKRAGIRQLHVMCHSMGTRFFLRAFATIKDVFQLKLSSPSGSLADLASLAMYQNNHHDNTNGSLGAGKPPSSPYAANDETDYVAPDSTQNDREESSSGNSDNVIIDINNNKKGKNKNNADRHQLPTRRKKRRYSANEGISLVNLILINPDYELETFKNDYQEIKHFASRITIYADHRDAAIRLAFKLTSKQMLGNNVNPLRDHKGRALDIDLIDTGDLDRNTNSTFHSFFNINRLMVDDLYDLIVTGKRAKERNSRLKRWGEVYRFTILPSSVVMV